ncbi:hypothetical protein CDIK_1968 [Cucumispora dikerogammari]|nr:hypothetical protein CDIK_1968 [Cucumispora dikerogammari]
MNPLTLSQLFDKSNDLSFSGNKVGYLYNLKAKKYFNCNNETKAGHILPTLTTIPSAPWTIKEKTSTTNFIFKCGNGQVIDIAWNDYITIYNEHGKTNQQITVEIVSSNSLDEIVLQNFNDKKEKHCFGAKGGRVLVEDCDDSKNANSGQTWYWIPENLVNEIILKPILASLDE